MKFIYKGTNNTTKHNRWFHVPFPKNNPDVRLFCFPYAGGSAEMFHNWARRLPNSIEMFSVQLPGRSYRINEKPVTRLSTLIEALEEAIKLFQDLPFAFYGHSMGALIAFELTRYFQEVGKVLPVHLFVSGRRAPQIPSLFPPIHMLPDIEFKKAMRCFNVPEAILENNDFIEHMMPTIRADFELIETWKFYPRKEPLSVPIWAMGGNNDFVANQEHMEAWYEQTKTDFRFFMFSGDHYFINHEQDKIVKLFVKALSHWL